MHAVPERSPFGGAERAAPARRRRFGGPLRIFAALALVAVLAIATTWIVTGGTAFDWISDVSQSTGVRLGTPAQTQRGIDAYRRGDRATAERELNAASRSYRRSAIALLYLAQMRIEAGNMVGAGPYLDEAISREPDNPAVRRMAGEYHLTFARTLAADSMQADEATSHLELAEDHLSYVVSLDPSDRRARGFLACVLTALGRATEARTALSAAGSGRWDRCARPSARALVPSPSPM
jgi:Tfp pilus assembly protein PilF